MIPTREIMWNVSEIGNVIAMYTLMTLSLGVAAAGLWRHAEIVLSGKSSKEHLSNPFKSTWSFIKNAMFQRKVVKKRDAGYTHTLIYFGFLVLLFTTTMVFIDHDLGIHIYQGDFYLGLTVFSDIFGLAVIIGCGLAAYRRWQTKPDYLHSARADNYLLWMLALLCIQGFLLEGLRIHATDDPWAHYSIIGNIVAGGFWGLSDDSTRTFHFIIWWFHTITVFAFIALIPYSKFFHIFASSLNLYFAPRSRPKGQLESPGDIESLIEAGEEFPIGLGTIEDYSWKHLLDLEACTSCGRCQEVCPAYLSGKPLSPKWLILDTRNHLLALGAEKKFAAESKLPTPLEKLDEALQRNYLDATSHVQKAQDGESYEIAHPTFRAGNELTQQSVKQLGGSAEDRIASEVIDENVFWTCTTCMACVEACPVGINHVDQIVGNRQNMVLMQGEVPSEAASTLKALETRTNPYGAPEDRVLWLDGLSVKILEPGDSVDYLYWVGCVSAYDKRKQKIARSLVTLMKEAGLSFGILGTAEGCTGDPARRLGEENLFQTLAKQNIETLKSVQFKTLVANCPHCFNTIKNEYPEFGNLGNGQSPDIIHHSTLLKKLLDEGKLVISEQSKDSFTFHDPCYLGRYNDEYDAPREVVQKSSAFPILESEQSREKGMCCGAGGGHFWMDLKIGDRVNAIRVDQLAATGAQKIATACPFCMQMLEDGVKLTDREEAMEVKDMAEVLVELVQTGKEH